MMGNTALNTLWPGDETLIFIYGSMKNPIGKLLLPCVIIWESILIIASVYRSSVCNKGIQFHFIWYFPNFFFAVLKNQLLFHWIFLLTKFIFLLIAQFSMFLQRDVCTRSLIEKFSAKNKKPNNIKTKSFCVCLLDKHV